MCKSISELSAWLENCYDVIDENLFDSALSKRPVITIQSSPNVYGHFTTFDAWRDNNDAYKEINLGAETINRDSVNIISTLIHEMTHYYCYLNNIQDTSRNGRYHNKHFKVEAEKRLIVIDYDDKIGWSLTTPSSDLYQFIQEHDLDFKSDIFRECLKNGVKVKKPTSTRKYICPCCGQSVRATRDVNIMCIDCDEVMVKV